MAKFASSNILLYSSLVFLAVVTVVIGNDGAEEGDAGSKGHGFGEKYDWVSFDDAYSKSQELNKPVMLVIHKTWCGACKSLGPRFAESDAILELSDKFVMVNTVDDEEPTAEVYRPDGGYIPRILFLDSNEKLLEVINESGNPKYQYFYTDDSPIVDSMKKALTLFASGKDEL